MATSYVVDGAVLGCTMGVSTSALKVLPSRNAMLRDSKRANVGDSKPLINIHPFGICKITSAPCVPACALWSGGKGDFLVEGLPALLSDSQLICTAGAGIITIEDDGQ